MSKKKLSLNRETLTTLSPSALDAVNGGGTGLIIKVSKKICRPILTTALDPAPSNYTCGKSCGAGIATCVGRK